jgi:hypothetical protein
VTVLPTKTGAASAGGLEYPQAEQGAAAQVMQAIGEYTAALPVNLGWALREEGDPDAARSLFGAGLRTTRRNGDHAGIAYANLGLAYLAADRGDWHQAGVLHGVAQAFSTGPKNHGRTPRHAIAGKASMTRGAASARTSSTRPAPRAWRSELTRS